jgi:hypothetical protein
MPLDFWAFADEHSNTNKTKQIAGKQALVRGFG